MLPSVASIPESPARTRREGSASRLTRAEQRAATKQAILDATVECLIRDGYGALATRRIAERAGIAQSTLMHHFPTRDALLVESVTHLAMRMAEQALAAVDLTHLKIPDQREAVLDQTFKEFTSPPAVAAAQLWAAAWAEPELAPTLRDIEERLTTIIVAGAGTFLPAIVSDARFPALLDATITLIRGLVMAIPISGIEVVEQRWGAMKPFLLEAAAHLLDTDAATR